MIHRPARPSTDDWAAFSFLLELGSTAQCARLCDFEVNLIGRELGCSFQCVLFFCFFFLSPSLPVQQETVFHSAGKVLTGGRGV